MDTHWLFCWAKTFVLLSVRVRIARARQQAQPTQCKKDMKNRHNLFRQFHSVEPLLKQPCFGSLPLREAFPSILEHLQVSSWVHTYMVIGKPYAAARIIEEF